MNWNKEHKSLILGSAELELLKQYHGMMAEAIMQAGRDGTALEPRNWRYLENVFNRRWSYRNMDNGGIAFRRDYSWVVYEDPTLEIRNTRDGKVTVFEHGEEVKPGSVGWTGRWRDYTLGAILDKFKRGWDTDNGAERS
jgi:hypothetical protein